MTAPRAAIAPAAALAICAALTLFPAPAAAQVNCAGPQPSPYYCIPPFAVTVDANPVGATAATLHGAFYSAGSSTEYEFQYGRTRAYGFITPTKFAPAGQAPSDVSARVFGLRPNSIYHFRLIAVSSGGIAYGADKTFKTKKLYPIRSVHAPHAAKHGTSFKVTVRLRTTASVRILLLLNGHVVKRFPQGSRTGRFKVTITAPQQTGSYVIKVVAKGGGRKQSVTKSINVF